MNCIRHSKYKSLFLPSNVMSHTSNSNNSKSNSSNSCNSSSNHNRRYEREGLITCQFYNKIGACRHGEKCSKKHIKPTNSKTLILANLYQNPKLNKNESDELSQLQLQESLDLFFQDVFIHLSQKGEIASLVVCENENNHLNGNVYVRFYSEKDAQQANQELNQEWFNGRPVHSDLSPVYSFDEARCRAYDTNSCERGEMCNYMHLRLPTKSLLDKLTQGQEKKYASKRLERLKIELRELGGDYDAGFYNGGSSDGGVIGGDGGEGGESGTTNNSSAIESHKSVPTTTGSLLDQLF